MNASIYSACLTLALASSLSCDAQSLSIGGGEAPLEAADVDAIPAGSARGDEATGAYLITSFDVASCRCREGDGCGGDFRVDIEGLWLDQTDGALSATAVRGGAKDTSTVLRGGIDGDGTFDLGAVLPVTVDGAVVGDSYFLFLGVVQPQDAMDGRWLVRARYITDGVPVDCAVQADVTLAWWDSAFDDGGSENGSDSGDSGEDAECDLSTPCGSPEPICFAGECQAGVEGDGCVDLIHCAVGNVCVDGSCWDGSEGDPCDNPVHCAPDQPHCTAGACHDGSEGDPCELEIECDLAQGLSCGPEDVCV